jgi:hypothetical protein
MDWLDKNVKYLLTRKKILVIIVWVLLIITLTYFFVRCVLNIPVSKNTEPESCPLEINRIFSTDKCFSIISPPNWYVDVYNNIIKIDTINKNSPVVQNHAGIIAMKEGFIQDEIDYAKRELSVSSAKTSLTNDNKKYVRIVFQDKPAINVIEEKKTQLEQRYSYECRLYFIRDEEIYSIVYYTNKYHNNIPSQSIIDYINSFRIENPKKF